MRALVSGAAGFIGSHLCEKLIADGHTVIGIDNLSTGSYLNLREISKHKNFHFIAGDLGLLALNSVDGCDWVFHLAAKADIVPSIEQPLDYHDANVTGTLCMLQAARKYGVKKFIYAGSSSCYGIPDDFPTSERSEIRPEYPYALTKNIGEQYVMHWARVYKVPAVSLRFFNVYGPRARTSGAYGAVFGVFLSQLANHKPVTIVGDGEQTRDFTFVSDVVDGLILAAKADVNKMIFNLGSGGTYSINRIADLLGAKDRVYIPRRPGEPGITFADITKAREILGFLPKVTIERGCAIMRDLIQSFKDAPLWTAEKIKEETKSWFTYLGG